MTKPTTKSPTEKPKRLSTNPFLLFEQATHVQSWNAGKDENDDTRNILIFARKAQNADGLFFWQIAAYRCDKNNRVLGWRKRYDFDGAPNVKRNLVLRNLTNRIINDLIQPQLIENLRS